MNRLKRNLFLFPVFTSFCLSLSSCSAFFNTGSQVNSIANVTTSVNSTNGDTIVTITFTDEEKDPVSFIIPKGVSGKDGVSIKDVKSTLASDSKSVDLEISFSDDSKTILTIPVLEGKGIAKIDVSKDSDGNNVSFQFTYTDGSMSELISIPKGKDGVGIKSFDVEEPKEDGTVLINVTFTDGNTTSFSLKNGKDGRDGIDISSILLNETKSDDEHYVLTVTYSDGFAKDISLPRPKSTKWYTGASNPSEDSKAALAKEGDFYLNRLNGYVYQKESDGSWTFLFGMKGDSQTSQEVYHTICFDPLDGLINNQKGQMLFNVLEGKTMDLNNIPTPVLDGSEFLGWYTSLTNVNSGKFTDMVPIYKDLTLYAMYKAL